MASLLDRKLLVLTGKGGVGKTTVSAALGVIAADRGLRTIVVEMGQEHRLAELFGAVPAEAGAQTELRENLWSVSIDPDRALLEWLQSLGGRVSGRVLASSGTFQYFAAAAPGARELISMVTIWMLTEGRHGRGRRADGYDLVILDAQATGHALGMLHSPQTFGAIARVGPIAAQTRQVGELLADPARSAYLAVALPTEMAVTEALELQDGLHRQIGRTLDAVVVNGTLPRRFSAAELTRIEGLDGSDPSSADNHSEPGEHSSESDVVTHSAALAARAVHDRANFQHNQLARLRRRDFEVHPVPFLFVPELDLSAVERIAGHLSQRL
ncbi:MAG TPA: ArsA family ATPase [Solirubrobacteraceae bacterium]|jgi:anion-transporting  ArsA/GET3 family ATPase